MPTESLSDPVVAQMTALAERLADAARAIIAPLFRAELGIDDKPSTSEMGQPVTRADREAEAAMRDILRATHPDHGIVGEEHGADQADAEWCWVIDPIDGTRAFISGLPLFGTLIGLMHQGRPLIGVIDQPIVKDRFVGTPAGTTLNGDKVTTRSCPDLDAAVYALTDPRMMKTPAQKATFARLLDGTHVCQFGGNCYAYGMLAAGSIDLITEADLKLWDICALVPVIEGAGGIVTGWDGGAAVDNTAIVAAGDPTLHAQVLPWLQAAI